MSFWSKKKWLNKIICFYFLKPKAMHKISSRNSIFNICIKIYYITCILPSPTKVFLTTGILHSHWTAESSVKSIAGVILSENISGIYDLSDLLFFFFVSDCTFDTTVFYGILVAVLFVLIALANCSNSLSKCYRFPLHCHKIGIQPDAWK